MDVRFSHHVHEIIPKVKSDNQIALEELRREILTCCKLYKCIIFFYRLLLINYTRTKFELITN